MPSGAVLAGAPSAPSSAKIGSVGMLTRVLLRRERLIADWNRSCAARPPKSKDSLRRRPVPPGAWPDGRLGPKSPSVHRRGRPGAEVTSESGRRSSSGESRRKSRDAPASRRYAGKPRVEMSKWNSRERGRPPAGPDQVLLGTSTVLGALATRPPRNAGQSAVSGSASPCRSGQVSRWRTRSAAPCAGAPRARAADDSPRSPAAP